MDLQMSNVLIQETDVESDEKELQQVKTVQQEDMADFEQKLCEFTGAPYCITVESATTGMIMALKTAGIEAGDTVLCTSFSYFATAEIIRLAGGVPVLVDINPNTYNIDPFCLEYVIGKCIRDRQPSPKALIAVDLFGLPCNYEALEEICEKYGIHLIEDMAQSFGASFHGKRTGGFGRMAVASFFPAKPLDELGEGGVVFCHSLSDLRRLESLRRTIRLQEKRVVLYTAGGYLDSVQASIAAEKLELLDFELECRREAVAHYRHRLDGLVKLQQVGEEYESAYTQFVISLPDPLQRDSIYQRLWDAHIPCQIFDPSPLRRRDGVYDWEGVALVNAKSVASKVLSLPIHPYLSKKTVDYICDCLIDALEQQMEEEEITDCAP